jgi:hypothetical protein
VYAGEGPALTHAELLAGNRNPGSSPTRNRSGCCVLKRNLTPRWYATSEAGSPRPGHRVGDLAAYDATWSSDGQTIVYSKGYDLYLASINGSESRKLVTTIGTPSWPRWSPDQKKLRFTSFDPRPRRRHFGKSPADYLRYAWSMRRIHRPGILGQQFRIRQISTLTGERNGRPLVPLREQPHFRPAIALPHR